MSRNGLGVYLVSVKNEENQDISEIFLRGLDGAINTKIYETSLRDINPYIITNGDGRDIACVEGLDQNGNLFTKFIREI